MRRITSRAAMMALPWSWTAGRPGGAQRLGRRGYQPPDLGDAITHWMKYDSWRPPSQPHTTFPQTRGYQSARPASTSRQTLERHERSTLWFELHRRGGRVILHHGHIRPVLIRDWSTPMDGINATIWASQTTMHHGGPARDPAAWRPRPEPGNPGQPDPVETVANPSGGA